MITNHFIDKFCDGVDERPDPFVVCLLVHSAARDEFLPANGVQRLEDVRRLLHQKLRRRDLVKATGPPGRLVCDQY